MKEHLRRAGYHEHEGDGPPPPRTFAQRSSAPSAQTPRWRLVRSLIQGGRLHLGRNDGELRRQLASLRATELSSGGLRVESRKDDAADACALACEIAVQLPGTDGPDGSLVFVDNGFTWRGGGGGIEIIPCPGTGWFRRYRGGRLAPSAPPLWHAAFESYAVEQLAAGRRSRDIEAWLATRAPEHLRRHYAPMSPAPAVEVRGLNTKVG
jgi:hypothetical protein